MKKLAQVSGDAVLRLDDEIALRFGSLSLISYILCDWSGNFSVCVCKEEGIGDHFLQLEQCS